jgi:hypothetical protein
MLIFPEASSAPPSMGETAETAAITNVSIPAAIMNRGILKTGAG